MTSISKSQARPERTARVGRAAWRAVSVCCAVSALACSPPTTTGTDASAGPIVLQSVQQASIEAPLPDFALIDQHGRPVKLGDLAGKVWVADFIFTTCQSVCPRLTETLAGVAGRLPGANVRFVSFSVDPENDTPEKLEAFAKKHGADSERWLFLTGDPVVMKRTVLEGFRMALGKSEGGEIFHAERFVVVDQRGTIRAVFDSSPEGVAQLEAKVRELTGD